MGLRERAVAPLATVIRHATSSKIDCTRPSVNYESHMQIYDFSSFSEYLKSVLKKKQEKNPRFSLRAWSTQVGLKNPSTLSRVLNKKGTMPMSYAKKLAETLSLKEDELRYFELLVLIHEAEGTEQETILKSLLTEVKNRNPKQTLISQDIFAAISQWYHLAIRELVALKEFREDATWIAKKLNDDITPTQATEAIERMLRLGLLIRNDKQQLIRAHNTVALVESEVRSTAIRSYHQQLIELALKSIHGQPTNERFLLSSTMAVRRSDYEKLVAILENMHKEMLSLTAQNNADEVYQVCTQAFRLTKDYHEKK